MTKDYLRANSSGAPTIGVPTIGGKRWLGCAALSFSLLLSLAHLSEAQAEDKVEANTTWYQEARRGPLSGLTVIHPQFDLGADVGEKTSISLGYAADAVSGATAAVYSVDAVSSATEFSDLRHQGSAGLSFKGQRSALTIGAGLGVERDYRALSISVSGNVDMPGKNTNLGISYSHSFDEVCDFDNGMATAFERRPLTGQGACAREQGIFGTDTPGDSIWRDLSIDTSQATITQNISPTLVAQIALHGQVLRGFQSNPYRRVRVSGVEAQEHVPDIRGRLALMARANKFLPSLRSAVHGMLRGYSDTWGVNSFSASLAYSQYFGQNLLLRLGSRIHQQSEATFFKDAFFYETEGSSGEYFTGDRELGAIRNISLGGKFSYITSNEDGKKIAGLFDELRFHLKGELLLLDELPSDPIEENREGIDRQFLSSGQSLDAIVLQLGIRARY